MIFLPFNMTKNYDVIPSIQPLKKKMGPSKIDFLREHPGFISHYPYSQVSTLYIYQIIVAGYTN